MLALALLVVTVAAVDSLNPSTLATATFFAVGRHAVRDLALFTLGVFSISLAGGVVLILGPGQALLAVVSTPSEHLKHLGELVAGLALVAGAVVLWLGRGHVARHLSSGRRPRGRSAFLVGAGIMAVELPTAVPYFGALAALVASHQPLTTQLTLVLVYNVVFVAPLCALLLVAAISAKRGARLATAANAWLARYGAPLFAVAVGVIGAVLAAVGAHGLWSS